MKYTPILYMMIGLPACGKSTFIKANLLDVSNHVIISSDSIIESIAKKRNKTYDEIFEEIYPTAQKLMYEKLESAIKEELTVIWDQTNLTVKARKNKLDLFPDSYYKVAIEFFNLDLATEEARIDSRIGKHIPERVLKNMRNQIEMVSYAEGFDEIWIVNPYTGLIETVKTGFGNLDIKTSNSAKYF